MIGTPFIIGPNEQAQLEDLRDRAAQAPVDMRRVSRALRTRRGKRLHMQQMTQQTIELPFGYAVTFSIETNHPGGSARHLSMSSSAPGRVPNEYAVWMVAEILGFVGGPGGVENALGHLTLCTVWLEELQGHGQAVNVVQFLNQVRPGRA